MSEKKSSRDRPNHKIKTSDLSSGNMGLQVLPLSPKEFQARWALSEECVELGSKAASADGEPSRMVLRAYSLPLDAERTEFSNFWHDFGIDRLEGSAFFTLPGPVPKLNAAIGLVNKSGRFSPLVRGEAVVLPPLPPPPQPNASIAAENQAPGGEPLAYGSTPFNSVRADIEDLE